jgi:CubicO group peptidase (beta-lactamase class C family)
MSQDLQKFARTIDATTGDRKLPGIVLAAVDKSGATVFSHTSGRVSATEKGAEPISLDSVFSLASCTKLVTTVAALQCVDKGWVTLDDPLDQHLPELAQLDLIAPNEDAVDGYVLSKSKGGITLRDLLTHTSGVAYDIISPQLQTWQTKNRGQPSLAFAGKFFGALDVPLIFEPGQSWMYGAGLDWVGLLVGRLSGMSFAAYCSKNIFESMGMNSATFHLESNDEIRSRLVAMCTRTPEGQLIEGGFKLADPAEDDLGGLGLYSSARDYLRVLQDLVQDKPSLLSSSAVEEMFKPQLPSESSSLADMKKLGPLLWGFYMSDHEPLVNHGMGAIVTSGENVTSGTPEGVLRWSGYTGPLWAISRGLGVAWLVATQLTPFGDPALGSYAEEFSRLVFEHASGRVL